MSNHTNTAKEIVAPLWSACSLPKAILESQTCCSQWLRSAGTCLCQKLLELGQRRAGAKLQDMGQVESEGAENTENPFSHILQTPSQIPWITLFCTSAFPAHDRNKG